MNNKIINNCDNESLLRYFEYGDLLDNNKLNQVDKELVFLIDEYTLIHYFSDDINVKDFYYVLELSIRGSLEFKDKNLKLRKNKKREEIYKFLFCGDEFWDNLIFPHIVTLILQKTRNKIFDTLLNKTDITNQINNNTLQKIIGVVVDSLVLFLNFYNHYYGNVNNPNTYFLEGLVFYIIITMSKTNYKNKPIVSIIQKKIINDRCIQILNKVSLNFNIKPSIWFETMSFTSEFTNIKLNCNLDYICPTLFLYSQVIIKQKFCKKNTEYTGGFVKTIFTLANSRVFICYNMLEKIKTLVDIEYGVLCEREATLLKKFRAKFEKYNQYKKNNNIESNELWLLTSLDILLNDYKQVATNDHINKKNIEILERIHVDILLPTTAKNNLKKIKQTISKDEKKILESLNKKKYLLQLEISKLQKHLSEIALTNFWFKYYEYLKLNRPIFIRLIAYGDFRGRIYYKSPISLQSNWKFRFIYHLGDVDCNSYNNTSITLPSFFNVAMYQKMKDYGIYDIKLFYTLFSLGALFKNEVDQDSGFKSLAGIFYKGLEIWYKYNNNLLNKKLIKYKDLAEITYLINIIISVNNGIFKKWYIIKDTTASVNQHMGKVLGFKAGSLKYVNLDNDTHMFDTYQLYIDYFKSYFSSSCPEITSYITRGLLKKVIMTVPYGVSSDSAFKYYFDEVQNIGASEDIKKKLLSNFHKIYNILNDQIIETNYLYVKNKASFIKETADLDFFTLDDIKLYNEYYLTKKYTIEFRVGGVRKSITLQEADPKKIDKKKTDLAKFVNLIHMLDAYYLRKITQKMGLLGIDILTIHDAFALPYYEVGVLLLYANDVFSVTGGSNLQVNINLKTNINSNSILI